MLFAAVNTLQLVVVIFAEGRKVACPLIGVRVLAFFGALVGCDVPLANAIANTQRLAGKKWALVVATSFLEIPCAFYVGIAHVHRTVAVLTFGVALALS